MLIKNTVQGVETLYFKTDKFKTMRISINFYLPLKKETVTTYSLLPLLLTSSCERFKSYRELSEELNRLYGASISSNSGKCGDSFRVSFSISSLDDKFIPNGEKVLSNAAELLFDMIFFPEFNENGDFTEKNIERERRLLIENIKSDYNNKRFYAIKRSEDILYKGTDFESAPTVEAAKKIDKNALKTAYTDLISNSAASISVIGASDPDNIINTFLKRLAQNERNIPKLNIFSPAQDLSELNRVEEKIDVSQGKMVLQFTTGVTADFKDFAAFTVMSDIFGGGPYSKLFLNVREKLSLCYYCKARASRLKGVLTVDCGVEKQNIQTAEKEILNQLELIKNGEVTEEELSASKMSITDSFKTIFDETGGIESFYSSQTFDKNPCSLSEYIAEIDKLSISDIKNAAQKLKLQLVYTLSPKEEN